MSRPPRRRYTPTQQFGTMLLALNEGIVVAEQKTGTPQSTIYSWFHRSVGGVKEVRSFTEVATHQALLTAEQAIYAQIASQGASEEELYATFRKLVEARLMSHEKSGINVNVNQQQAQGANGNLSAAEAAYIAALRGQPSLESGPDVPLPALPLSGNGAGGPLPSEDSE